jgi:NADPH:quinone reductase-like Zn-dependent oxidoreductase
MMKAVIFNKFGGPEVLEYMDVPMPKCGHDEVILAIKASSLNHVDLDIRDGISRLPITFPHILGLEFGGWQECK